MFLFFVLATSAFLLFVRHASVTFRVFCRKWLDFISRLMFRVISPASSVSLFHSLLHSWASVQCRFISWLPHVLHPDIQLLVSILASAISPLAHVSSYTLDVGGHCLAFSFGVSIQFCCFSPFLWLEVRSWPPSHHHGLLKFSHLSCQRSPAFKVVAAQ